MALLPFAAGLVHVGMRLEALRNNRIRAETEQEMQVIQARRTPPSSLLSGPDAHVWAWQLRGRCRGVDSSMIFSPDGERGHRRAHREARAKDMCRRCPVMTQCRARALIVGEPYGVWGGLSAAERLAVIGRDRRTTDAPAAHPRSDVGYRGEESVDRGRSPSICHETDPANTSRRRCTGGPQWAGRERVMVRNDSGVRSERRWSTFIGNGSRFI